MNRKINALFLIAAAIVFLGTGCQKKDLASGNTIKIFYAAIEDGDYYEGWAEQLQQQAKSYGMALEAGYAQNSVETQHSQIKRLWLKNTMYCCAGWYLQIQ